MQVLDLSQEFHPVPKPSHKRRARTRKQNGAITDKVRKEVLRRSRGACERCGTVLAYAFEMAHLIKRSQGGSGREPWNIMLLCGPSTDSGTCHHFADYTAQGRAWRMKKRAELMKLYNPDEWK
jgi:5-methylcytosine-specific restriction endonuclease McrA